MSNAFAETNWNQWRNREADRLMKQADGEPDPQHRASILEGIHELEAEDFLSLPLYLLPAISVWRADKIACPIGVWSSSPYGLFFNIEDWYLP